MGDKQMLLDMGFAQDRVDWALYATGNKGLQPTLDHLEANQDHPVPTDYKTAPNKSSTDHDYDDEDEAALADIVSKQGQQAADDVVNNVGEGEAKSIKCTDCGKIFKSAAFASFHAEKAGHTSFEESTEEIKPLTEEEKKAKLEQLRAKLSEKRAAQSKVDAEESRANEKIRRKAAQDLDEIRDNMQRKERMREAEQKRKEKVEDAAFKARIKAQIEADKRERAEKAANDKAIREGRPTSESANVAPTNTAAPKVAASTSNEARLRVRAPGGTWTGTLPADATLQQLQDAVIADDKHGGVAQLKFSTTFPRKFFTAVDANKTLRELGLVPNAALEASAM